MTKAKPKVLSRADWATHPDLFWKGHVEGHALGTGATVLFYSTEEVGGGPKWHVHPYDEIFIIREGRALFTVGDERFECEKGQVVFGPAHVPHKFVNLGPGRLETTDVHVSDRWIQCNLPDPEIEAG
ncbi:cupin domain-containing protein [Microvirga sp. BT688]|uniref:cupin domain-containing protein n=1 Tax=Microvirga sp. TaxID=1873136 RepID=UPI00168491C8|nr:cupin domain-containing protein [Microvirga sp.]MBD2748249.1 cupin domain-containing protein [Microvirga sp.]